MTHRTSKQRVNIVNSSTTLGTSSTYNLPFISSHMRQSVAANRISHAPSAGAGMSSAAAQAKLLEKKKEYDAVTALERASALYLERIEALGADCDIMANAGEVHGQVLSQWPKMFQILSTFLQSRESFNHKDQDPDAPIPQGQKLVRVPIEELQQAQADKS